MTSIDMYGIHECLIFIYIDLKNHEKSEGQLKGSGLYFYYLSFTIPRHIRFLMASS